MNRPWLEVASWIAGIASTAIAFYALISNIPSDSSTVPSPVAAPASSLPIAKSRTKPDSSQPSLFSKIISKLSPKTEAEPPEYAVKKIVPDLSQALDSAHEIIDVQTRDKALSQVFTTALDTRTLDVALAAAEKVTNVELREQRLILLTCWAVAIQQLELARKTISVISQPAARDQALATFSREASIEWQVRNPRKDCGQP